MVGIRILSLLLAGLLAMASHMQEAQAQGVLEACETDIGKFCSGVTPGNGHILACMYAYEDQISDGCASAIVDVGDALDHMFFTLRNALATCAADIESYCADTQFGEGRILSCLSEKAADITSECKAVVDEFAEELAAE